MIKVSVITGQRSGTIPVEFKKFPCGESFVRIDTEKLPLNILYDQVSISISFQGNTDLIDLLLLVDALKRSLIEYKKLVLSLGYFPYGRQDRVCQAGEPHSLKVVANLINSCGFDKVFVVDPHSDVIEGVIDNVSIVSQVEILDMLESDFIYEYQDIVSPDAGAYKKAFKVAQHFNRGIVRADKIRDLSDGSLSGFEVYAEELTGRDVLIVDDICDGGGTFIGLAKKLREKGAKSVGLYVSHGMFTKGVEILKEHIDKIYCYNYYGSNSKDFELIEALKARQNR